MVLVGTECDWKGFEVGWTLKAMEQLIVLSARIVLIPYIHVSILLHHVEVAIVLPPIGNIRGGRGVVLVCTNIA